MDYFDIHMSADNIKKLSSLGLAHVGDAVFEIMVRSKLALEGKETAANIHRKAVKLVSAPAQAAAAEKMLPYLTEKEMDIFRRGRNAKVNSVPHSATLGQYHEATALEALFGYLYLQGEKARLNELFEIMMGETNAS